MAVEEKSTISLFLEAKGITEVGGAEPIPPGGFGILRSYAAEGLEAKWRRDNINGGLVRIGIVVLWCYIRRGIYPAAMVKIFSRSSLLRGPAR
jgi:hypothetical protein